MPEWYFQFLADVITQLPRPGAGSGCIAEAGALQFHNNRGVLKEVLHEALLMSRPGAGSGCIAEVGALQLHDNRGVLKEVLHEALLIEVQNKYLKLLYPESVIIGPCDGSETLAEAHDVFEIIDTDFERWGANKRGRATGSTPVWVCELKEDAMFTEMFGDPDRVCFSQHQVKKFCRENPQYLSPSTTILIPFRVKTEKNGEEERFFVAFVYMGSGGALKVFVYQFECSDVWLAVRRPRVVVPCLPAGAAQLAV